MSDDINQGGKRLKSLADSGVKYIEVNGKCRRLCSINNCEKQSQREGLCTRHRTEKQNRQ